MTVSRVAAVALLIVVGTAAPARASSTAASCTAPYLYPPLYRTCTTGEVGASAQHAITLTTKVCEGSPWRVWDVASGHTVAAGSESTVRVISGLFGTYQAKLTNACWKDRITVESRG